MQVYSGRRSLCLLRGGRAKAQDGDNEKQAAHNRKKEELRPEHVKAGTAVEDRLRERDKKDASTAKSES